MVHCHMEASLDKWYEKNNSITEWSVRIITYFDCLTFMYQENLVVIPKRSEIHSKKPRFKLGVKQISNWNIRIFLKLMNKLMNYSLRIFWCLKGTKSLIQLKIKGL